VAYQRRGRRLTFNVVTPDTVVTRIASLALRDIACKMTILIFQIQARFGKTSEIQIGTTPWLLTLMPQPSAESNFRSNLSQFRWARGVTDDSQPVQDPSQPSNPFARFYNSVAGDYVPLRSNERSNEEEAWFALSRWERCVNFFARLLIFDPTRDVMVDCLGS
jgi:hypothetical protein